MSRSPSADPLEEALLRPPHLAAPDFTARVLASLPSRRRTARPWILAAGGLASCALGATLLARLAPWLGPAIRALVGGAAPGGEGLGALLGLGVVSLTALLALGELRAR